MDVNGTKTHIKWSVAARSTRHQCNPDPDAGEPQTFTDYPLLSCGRALCSQNNDLFLTLTLEGMGMGYPRGETPKSFFLLAPDFPDLKPEAMTSDCSFAAIGQGDRNLAPSFPTRTIRWWSWTWQQGIQSVETESATATRARAEAAPRPLPWLPPVHSVLWIPQWMTKT